ncbi:MAG: hypothetical protein IJP43_09710 [Oscillospiraceae bacterium]|nr:hypothetical protein [Oscillospiraceae bacterium]
MIITAKTNSLVYIESGYFDEGDDLSLAIDHIEELYPRARKRVIIAPNKWYTASLAEYLISHYNAEITYTCPHGTIIEWGGSNG